MFFIPALSRRVFAWWGGRVSEPEIKFIFLVLCALGALSVTARSEAVLPAYIFGMVVAGLFVHNKVLILRMRSIVFALLTPFFFLKAGTLVSLPALLAGLGVLLALFWSKMIAKVLGGWTTCRLFRMPARDAMLSHGTTEVGRGWGFGFHEAMDQTGAVLGPLIIALVLYLKGGYRAEFAYLLIPAILALLVIIFAARLLPHPQHLEVGAPKLETKGLSRPYCFM
jgi:Kef-type K+ transport system membrane component KefB